MVYKSKREFLDMEIISEQTQSNQEMLLAMDELFLSEKQENHIADTQKPEEGLS